MQLALALAGHLLSAAQIVPAAEERQLIALDRRIQHAMVANDRRFLAKALASDFRFVHSNGFVQTKADVLRIAGHAPKYYLRRDIRNVVAELQGDTASVTGTLDVKSGPGEARSGTACYALRFIHVFSRRVGRWQLLRHDTTAMIEPERPC